MKADMIFLGLVMSGMTLWMAGFWVFMTLADRRMGSSFVGALAYVCLSGLLLAGAGVLL